MRKTAILTILIFSFSVFNIVSAQSGGPEFLVSWQARNYAPGWYGGKILPAAGSPVSVSFELIDSGKPVNLNQNTVRWYINDNLVLNEDNGLGIKSLETVVPNTGDNKMSVRITIVDYGNNVLHNTIIIPVVFPEVVISSPYSGNNIRAGLSVFNAEPFFFNVPEKNSLSVNWFANSVQAEGVSGEPWQLNLNLTNPRPGAKINLSASVRNLLNYLELASQNIFLYAK